MSNLLWPVYTVFFPAPPEEDAWEIFSSQVMMIEGCRGVESGNATGPETLKESSRIAKIYFDPTDSENLQRWLPDVREYLTRSFPYTAATINIEGLVEQNWGEEWRRYFHTMQIGPRTFVGPPWENELPADAPTDAIHILIEPGQAFGTGSHETTKLCLQLVEESVKSGDRLLDIGTGSGILLFAAVRLGAEYGLGVENDPVCEENFYLNAEINRIDDKVKFAVTDTPESIAAQTEGKKINLILCNMLSEQFLPVLHIVPGICDRLILSGFLLSEKEKVLASVAEIGFAPKLEKSLNEWGGLYCEKK